MSGGGTAGVTEAGRFTLRAFDDAMDAIRSAERHGMTTRTGESAAPRLARLRERLALERDRVWQGAAVDVGALGALVRDVAEWSPDTELKLLAALGAIIRTASR